MKRYLWVVERKDGDEWVSTSKTAMRRSWAREDVMYLRDFGNAWQREQKYRVVKYTPAE